MIMMKSPSFHLLRALLAMCLVFGISVPCAMADAPSRLAIVVASGDARLAAFGDLLTAELSKDADRIALVERAEIQRLAQEAQIQQLQNAERPLALARLAKADELVFVGMDGSDPKQPKLMVRMTSCSSGLIHRSLVLGGKEEYLPAAAGLAATSLRFAVRGQDPNRKPPVVVSLLGLRSAFMPTRHLEASLNSAIAHQLLSLPRVVVAERWKLDDVVFERSLGAIAIPDLSTASVLVDGSFESKGERLVVRLRIRNSGTDEGKITELNGDIHNPATVVQEIFNVISRHIGTGDAPATFASTEEARHFAALGEWLIARRMGIEAAQAYESAVALGDLRPVTLVGRLKAYAAIVQPMHFPPLSSRQSFLGFLGLKDLDADGFHVAIESAVRLSGYVRDLAGANWEALDHSRYDLNARCFLLERVVALNLEVLVAMRKRNDHLKYGEEARFLRELTRSFIGIGQAMQGNQFALNHDQCGHLYDTPEDAVAAYRVLLADDSLSEKSPARWFRLALWLNSRKSDQPRPVIDWTNPGNERAEQAWMRFADELRASTSLLKKADGLAIKFQMARDKEEKVPLLNDYCTLLEQRMEELAAPKGQLTLLAFGSQWVPTGGDLRNDFDERYTRILATMFERSAWADDSLISTTADFLLYWKKTSDQPRTPISGTMAERLLSAIEGHVLKARKNPQWSSKREVAMQDLGKQILISFTISSRLIRLTESPCSCSETPSPLFRPWDADGKRFGLCWIFRSRPIRATSSHRYFTEGNCGC